MRLPLGLGFVLLAGCGAKGPQATTPSPAADTRPQAFVNPYPSMDECVKVYKLKLAEYEKLWGESEEDNGSTYWRSAKETIYLSCNPVDDSKAELELVYQPPDPSFGLPVEPGNPTPFEKPYPGMTECMAEWTTMRVEYDKKWGASQTDNGAAYWKTATRNIELVCNRAQDEGPGAQMELRYTPLEAD